MDTRWTLKLGECKVVTVVMTTEALYFTWSLNVGKCSHGNVFPQQGKKGLILLDVLKF